MELHLERLERRLHRLRQPLRTIQRLVEGAGAASACSIADTTRLLVGPVVLPKGAIALPSRPTRYLLKFQLGALPVAAASCLNRG